jgi:hypothetical protein
MRRFMRVDSSRRTDFRDHRHRESGCAVIAMVANSPAIRWASWRGLSRPLFVRGRLLVCDSNVRALPFAWRADRQSQNEDVSDNPCVQIDLMQLDQLNDAGRGE